MNPKLSFNPIRIRIILPKEKTNESIENKMNFSQAIAVFLTTSPVS